MKKSKPTRKTSGLKPESSVSKTRTLQEFETLALEGLDSGEPIEVGPDYWERKHRALDIALKKDWGARKT